MPGAKKKALEKAGALCYRDFKFLLRPRCKESTKEIVTLDTGEPLFELAKPNP
jgi:hypothetical protein